MSNTPAAPAATPEPTGLHASFLKSLQLTVTPSDPVPSATGAPVPDTGVEVVSDIDFSEGSGSLADKLKKVEREVANAVPPAPTESAPPPSEATPPPPSVSPPPVSATPPPASATPPPAGAVPTQPEMPRVKIPELPKPIAHQDILPPPPSLQSRRVGAG
jgi:hypothetical protein